MNFPAVIFVVIVTALTIDVISGLIWWPDYFKFGIPIFVRKQQYSQALPALPGPKALTERYSGSWVLPLLFRRLSPTEIAVREAFWGGFFKITYTPLVHGLLEVDTMAREIKIVGRLNVFPLVFLAAFAVPLMIRMSARDPAAMVFLVFVVASLLLIQFVRYGNVVREALKLIEEP